MGSIALDSPMSEIVAGASAGQQRVLKMREHLYSSASSGSSGQQRALR